VRSRTTVAEFAARGVLVREADYSEPDGALAGVNSTLMCSSKTASITAIPRGNRKFPISLAEAAEQAVG
jgi:hypothetical protein